MAEQHYKDTRAAKAAQDSCDENADGPGAGYRFDLELCRRTFDAYDRDGSGFLDITELTELAEVRVHVEKQTELGGASRPAQAQAGRLSTTRLIPKRRNVTWSSGISGLRARSGKLRAAIASFKAYFPFRYHQTHT